MCKPYKNVHYSLLQENNCTHINTDHTDSEMMSTKNQEHESEISGTHNLSLAESDSYISEMNSVGKRNFNENITTVVHILTIQFVLYILYLSFSHEIELFTWHPILLSIGWSLLMTEAILAISNENWLTKFVSAKNRVIVHGILQTSASACIISGFIIVVVNKNLKNKEHFKTWHGTLGLVSLIFLIPTCLIGVFTLYKISLRQYINPRFIKVLHIFLGSTTFILGAVTVVLSLYSNWFVKKTNYTTQVVCFIAIVIISFWVLIRPLNFLSKNISQS